MLAQPGQVGPVQLVLGVDCRLDPVVVCRLDQEADFHLDPVVECRQDQEAVCLPAQAVDSQPAPAVDFRQGQAVDAQQVLVADCRLALAVGAPQAQARILIRGTGLIQTVKKLGVTKSTSWRWGLWADPNPINPYDWRKGKR